MATGNQLQITVLHNNKLNTHVPSKTAWYQSNV